MEEVPFVADAVALNMEAVFEDCNSQQSSISSSTSDDEDGEKAHVSPFKKDQDQDLNSDLASSIKRSVLVQPKILKASAARKSCSIHRVPHRLRKHNPNAYSPQFISIGPFHYQRRKSDLQAMEEHKWRYLRYILSQKPQGWLEHCLATIKRLENKARSYYSEVIELDSNPFIQMLLLDGCFILELLRRNCSRDNDVIFQLEWPVKEIYHDLILMENQIPFFILQRLYLLLDSSNRCHPLEECALNFLGQDNPVVLRRIDGSNIRIRHLLHLLHTSFVPFPSEFEQPADTPRIPCASRLEEVGIRFSRRNDSGSNFLNIQFHNGVIEIPDVEVWGKTMVRFLNLIAFEQSYLDCNKYITTYFLFMNCLINNPKDVEILCKEGIIEDGLGSEKLVADFFNSMTTEAIIYHRDFYLSGICEEINLYSKRRWPQLRASLMHNYFKNPWAIISFLAALILLLLTVTQTLFTIFPKFAVGN